MKLKLIVHKIHNILVIKLKGIVTFKSCSNLQKSINQLIKDKKYIVIDVSEVEFHSEILSVVTLIVNKLNKIDGKLLFYSGNNKNADEVMKMISLDKVVYQAFDMYTLHKWCEELSKDE